MKSAEFWDRQFFLRRNVYSRGVYAKRNRRLCGLIRAWVDCRRIFEFGGAEGHLAETILRTCSPVEYAWSDFSPAALSLASKRLQRHGRRVSLSLLDINEKFASIPWQNFDTVISTMLEHLENDRQILQAIPEGTQIILSLPNFPTEDHRRFFESISQVVSRYGDLLEIRHCEKFSLENWTYFLKRCLARLRLLPGIQKFVLKAPLSHPHVAFLIIAKRKRPAL